MKLGKNPINFIAKILVIIGAVNWGLAIFDMNLVSLVFGSIEMLETAVYGLVGLAGVWELILLFKK